MAKESNKGYVQGLGIVRIDHIGPKHVNIPPEGAVYAHDDREPRLYLKVSKKHGRELITNPGENETILGQYGSIGRDQAAAKAVKIKDIGKDEYDFSGLSADEKEVKAKKRNEAEGAKKAEAKKQAEDEEAREAAEKAGAKDREKKEAEAEEKLKDELEAKAKKIGLELHGNMSSENMQKAIDDFEAKKTGEKKPGKGGKPVTT